ncbi:MULTISPECIES: hypothetical protein [unclassified Polaribacter]|nr:MULTISPECIES: hypothetical protein [unclassified Polaribacter]
MEYKQNTIFTRYLRFSLYQNVNAFVNDIFIYGTAVEFNAANL